jgi:hypothetical protein
MLYVMEKLDKFCVAIFQQVYTCRSSGQEQSTPSEVNVLTWISIVFTINA